MRISNSTAKRTMTEFKGLELVTMERTNENASNSEYKITLNPKFKWFLSDEFMNLRKGFKPTNNREFLKTEPKSNNKDNDKENFAAIKNTPVLGDQDQSQQIQEEETIKGFQLSPNGPIHLEKDKDGFSIQTETNTNSNSNKDNDSHRGKMIAAKKKNMLMSFYLQIILK
ncbi:MAG TPA: hypothetical protein VJ697_15990 [Nitrososphaeraceae archaeon]|nr:hypothetical protein [Nitrososphaeraceae archaeon]